MIRSTQDLERELTELTTWPDAHRQIWRRALNASDVSAPRRAGLRISPILRTPRFVGIASMVGLAALIFVFVQMHNSELDRLTSGDSETKWNSAAAPPEAIKSRRAPVSSPGLVGRMDRMDRGRFSPETPRSDALAGLGYVDADGFNFAFDKSGISAGLLSPSGGDAEDIARNQPDSSSAVERFVVRKATMEILSPDVRAVFAKVMQVVSEAGGEFVQDSTITGTGKDTQAQLTLRVVAARLSAVLNELRQLGEVRSETTSGEDVTAQVVDIEARLRNERRVETELLELFDKRKDAPLKEVLELRDKLSQVRQGVEQLVAQRDRLSRLVSLATVLVIIRGKETPIEPAKPSILAYFAEACGKAWAGGLRILSDTVAGLLNVLVGGLVWWIALLAAVLLIRRWRRQRTTAA